MVNLKGKTAIVTGASQGIGREISLALSKHGMNVVVAARNDDKLRALENEIASAGGTSLAVKTDVRFVTECKRLVKQALDCYGQIDVLINNAALRAVGPIEMSDPEEITEMVKVNVLGVYYCTYAVLPTMKDRSNGHIINICSEVAQKSFPLGPMYAATKCAVRGFSEGLLFQLQRWGIRVTTVYPGLTDTPMVAQVTPEERKKFLRAEYVANAVIHVLQYPEDVSIKEIAIRSSWQET
jgi:NADP-dependent 3-hydroxy acid dehydrogenase YdfG